MNTSAIPPVPADNNATGTGAPSSQSLNNMFLQLLVAQLKNQSPLDPLDPSQFVGQLAQFSELSEVTQIEQILQQGIQGLNGASSARAEAGANSQPVIPVKVPTTQTQGGL